MGIPGYARLRDARSRRSHAWLSHGQAQLGIATNIDKRSFAPHRIAKDRAAEHAPAIVRNVEI